MNKVYFLLLFLLPGMVYAQLPGNSLQIKNHGNYVKVPDSLSTSLNNDMTLEAWVYYNCENGTSPRTIISKGSCSSTASYRFDIVGGAIKFTKWRNVSWSTINCSAYSQVIFQTVSKMVPYNAWSHIAVSIDDTTVQMYLNGALIPINTMVGTNVPGFKPSTDAIVIGSFYNQPNNYTSITANIDDVRIWHKAKTQAEIQSEMNTELVGNETDLFAYWKLNETGTGAGVVAANSAVSTGANYNGITAGTAANIFFVSTDSLTNSISNCDPLLWLKADKGVTYNANKEVSLWQDQGQLGNDVSMPTAIQKPKYKTNEINNKPIVRFDGVNDYLATTSIDLTAVNKIEIFYVAKSRKEGYVISHNSDPTVPNAFSITENSTNGTNGHSAVLNGNGTAQVTYKTSVTDSCYHTMNVQFDKSLTGLNQIKMFVDQNLLTNTNGAMVGAEMTNALSNAPLFIGGSSLSSLPFFGGDIAELIVYNKILTPAERNQVYAYLHSKYEDNYLSSQFTSGTPTTAFSNEITDDKEWLHAYHAAQPTQVLTSVMSNCLTFDQRNDSVFVESNAIPFSGGYFMRRHFVVHPLVEYPGTKTVRLYYSLSDFNNFQSVVPTLASHEQLAVVQYDGVNEDGIYDPSGGTVAMIPPSLITNGTAYGMHYLQFNVSHFSEFWISTGNMPLPIQDIEVQVQAGNDQHNLIWKCTGDCEEIVDYVVLESEDAQTFTQAAIVPANSIEDRYQHSIAASASANQYFMIEARSADDQFYRSKVYRVTNKHAFNVEVNYSPSDIVITTNREQVKIMVYTIYGQLVQVGHGTLRVNKMNLASGLYLATLTEKDERLRTIKFDVQ
jgi:hypothetical protein